MKTYVKRSFIIMMLLLGLPLVLPSNAQDQINGLADTPWPMYQHDPQHTGRSQLNGPVNALELLWTAQLPSCSGESGGISIADDGDLLLSIGGCLSRFDPISRQVQWRYMNSGNSRSVPLLSEDGNIYWGVDMIFAQISSEGNTQWLAELDPNLVFGSSSSFGIDGNLYFVHDGVWSFTPAGQYRWFIPYGFAGTHASPAVGLNGIIYAGTDIGFEDLCAYSPNGGIVWCLDVPGVAYDRTVAIGSNGVIYVPTEGNPEPPYTDSGVLVAVNSSGNVIWTFQPDEADIFRIADGMAISPTGSIYFVLMTYTSDSYLYSVDLNGQLLWKVAFGENPLTGLGPSTNIPITTDAAGNVYLCLDNSKCYGISLDGVILWEYEFPLVDSKIVAASTQPILAKDGLFYLADYDQRLYAFADPTQYPLLRTTNSNVNMLVEPGTGSFTMTIPITSTAAPITFTASLETPVEWLSIIQPIDIAPAQLVLQFNPDLLPNGAYHNTLQVVPNNVGNSINIPINLQIGMKHNWTPLVLNEYSSQESILFTSHWFTQNQFVSIRQSSDVREVIIQNLPIQFDWAVYAPDGRKVAWVPYINGNHLITIMDTNSGEIILEIGNGAETKYPAWSPQSDRIAFVSKRDDPYNGEVYVINLDGSGLTRLTENNLNESGVFWSPEGNRLALQVSLSMIYLINTDGTNFHQVVTGNHRDLLQGWSPDGKNLLLGSQASSDLDPTQLGIYEIQSGEYTSFSYEIIYSTWSPDGAYIAFVGHEEGNNSDWDIFVINADGTGKLNLTHDLYNEDSLPAWSPNSRWIAFTSRNDDHYNDPNYDIYVVRRDGVGLQQLTKNIQADYYPFWKP